MLILVRHGTTSANAAGLIAGRTEYPLDEQGAEESSLVARALGVHGRVISSPLARAVETARYLGESVHLDGRWIELDFGSWDGRPFSEVGLADVRQLEKDEDFRPPSGEKLADMIARVEDACRAIQYECVEQDVVVVTHATPIKAAVAWSLASSRSIFRRSHLQPGSVTRIACGFEGPVLYSLNETQHLSPEGSARHVSVMPWLAQDR